MCFATLLTSSSDNHLQTIFVERSPLETPSCSEVPAFFSEKLSNVQHMCARVCTCVVEAVLWEVFPKRVFWGNFLKPSWFRKVSNKSFFRFSVFCWGSLQIWCVFRMVISRPCMAAAAGVAPHAQPLRREQRACPTISQYIYTHSCLVNSYVVFVVYVYTWLRNMYVEVQNNHVSQRVLRRC